MIVSFLRIVHQMLFAKRSEGLDVWLTMSIHGFWALAGTVEVLMRSEPAEDAL